MPRPLRAWHGEEHGLHDLKPYEKEQVFTDDVLMMRFLLLFVISEEVRKAAGEEDPTALFLEQPADQANMPEVVTLANSNLEATCAALQLGDSDLQPI